MKLIQIVIQEKSPNRFEGYCVCRDEEGQRWEIPAIGNTPSELANILYKLYQSPNWALHGHKQFGKS